MKQHILLFMIISLSISVKSYR